MAETAIRCGLCRLTLRARHRQTSLPRVARLLGWRRSGAHGWLCLHCQKTDKLS